jgi:hypothetical protein
VPDDRPLPFPTPKKNQNALVCYYGTPWLDHFQPPIGTGAGCRFCDGENMTTTRKKTRVCGKTCHHAKGAVCRCWCHGLFHGSAGDAAREEFCRAFQVDAVPTTEGLFRVITGQPDLFSDGLGAGDDWRARVERGIADVD